MSLFTAPIKKVEELDVTSTARSWNKNAEACPRCLYITSAGNIVVDMVDGTDDEAIVIPVEVGFWAGTIKKLHTLANGTTASVLACW